MAKNKKTNGVKFLIALLILVVLIAISLLVYNMIRNVKPIADEEILEIQEPELELEPQPEVKTVQIYQGEDRPIAVMIDNHDDARPQVSINDAYIVYEIIVEGGYTRMMPIFKGVDLDEIGPIRSARHYFLDYALENDAIYVHYGESPQAGSDISKLDVDAINGIYQSSSDFWRTKGKYAPHNVLTSTQKVIKIAENKGYRTTSNEESILNYIPDDYVVLENGQNALEVYIPFSKSQNVSFIYDEESHKYKKFANGKKQVDWRSGDDIAFANIIISFIENYTLNDSENKGRQGINNITKADGYYITNGKAIEINCEKESRNSQTLYTDLDGNEIEVSDGNTYVAICPINAEVNIKGPEEPEETQGEEIIAEE